jgi:hypothetical protein
MLTPFEELEFLADYLPDEGEAVIVTRQGGDLHCEPLRGEDLREGIEDVELYGRLVQANERLNAQGALPLWTAVFVVSIAGILLYRLLSLGWGEWYLLPAIALIAIYACFHWIRQRQGRLFEREIHPMLVREAAARKYSMFGLMAGIRQHAEFRTLLDEMIRWEPARESGLNHP